MRFFNSLSKKIEIFPKQESVNIYSCGPTVYDFVHIGNLRTFLFEDLLIRTLKDNAYNIVHTRNITDIDDKTIKHAQEQNISLSEFTNKYTEEFFTDLKNLNFDQTSTTYLKATDYIQPMINMIQKLIDNNYAYETEDGVYFKTSSFNHYGDFAGLNLENIQQGASGHNSDFTKEDFGDFVLWKKYKKSDGCVYWESAWGKGRPGWHTECAAMVQHQYPKGLDIHTGGIDLLFPHHTNEKAHCECLSSKAMSKFWLHTTHLLVDNQKMSKSLGNFYTVRDLIEKGFDYKTIRFYLQTEAHYRSSLNFTLGGLQGANSALKRINNFICEIIEKPSTATNNQLKEKFDSHLHDDLNIPRAMGEIFTTINNFYHGIIIDTESTLQDLKKINQILEVFSFPQETILNNITQKLYDLRIIARKEKNWSESDRLRDELLLHGIEIRDNKDSVSIRKI